MSRKTGNVETSPRNRAVSLLLEASNKVDEAVKILGEHGTACDMDAVIAANTALEYAMGKLIITSGNDN